MTGHALRGAFDAVCAFNHSIYDFYDEACFKLYYLTMYQGPSVLVHTLPMNDTLCAKTENMLSAARSSVFNSMTTQTATGVVPKPSMKEVMTGFMMQSQNIVRPAMDLALRSGMNAPVRLAVLGVVALLLCDYLYGGPMRDSVSHLIAGINTGGEIKALSDLTENKTPDANGYIRISVPPSIS